MVVRLSQISYVAVLAGFASYLLLSANASSNDLAVFNDEFDSASTLSNWSRVNVTEGWNADQLETLSINGVTPGQMVLMPYTCTWFQDYRGPMLYKTVTGDVVITTSVRVTGRNGFSVPESDFSLAGLMIRAPRAITPQTWTQGEEDYVFFALGHGDNNGSSFEFEVKSTTNGNSDLILSNSPADNVILQIARVGNYVIVLRRSPGQPWVVHRRYTRADLPSTVQVGAVTYTNWEKASDFSEFDQNNNVLNPPLSIADPTPGEPFNPDVIATYDYIRYYRPILPSNLVGLNLANGGQVSDAELIAFLGDSGLCALDEAWVDFGSVASETGSEQNPFNTLAEALAVANPSATINIKGDTGTSVSGETMPINQAVTLQAVNGPVRIGDAGGRSAGGTGQSGFVSRE